MPIKILILDSSNKNRGEANAKSFFSHSGVGGLEVYLYDGERKVNLSNLSSEVELPEEFDAVILHNTDEYEWERLEKRGRKTDKIIRYTGAEVISAPANEVWIHRALTASEALTIEETRQILDWVNASINFQDDSVLLPGILGGSRYDAPLQLLSALLPVGLFWEATGKPDSSQGLKEAIEQLNPDEYAGFEAEIIQWLKNPAEHSISPRFRYLVEKLNSFLYKNLTLSQNISAWKKAGLEEPPSDLNQALNALLGATSLDNWNELLIALRDVLLND